MEPWVQTIVTVVCSVFASSGLWAFITTVINNKKKNDSAERQEIDALTNMVKGLGHAKIVEIGTRYLERGYVTVDELNEFDHYLFNPYEGLGGNGYAKKIHDMVSELPVVLEPPTEKKE